MSVLTQRFRNKGKIPKELLHLSTFERKLFYFRAIQTLPSQHPRTHQRISRIKKTIICGLHIRNPESLKLPRKKISNRIWYLRHVSKTHPDVDMRKGARRQLALFVRGSGSIKSGKFYEQSQLNAATEADSEFNRNFMAGLPDKLNVGRF